MFLAVAGKNADAPLERGRLSDVARSIFGGAPVLRFPAPHVGLIQTVDGAGDPKSFENCVSSGSIFSVDGSPVGESNLCSVITRLYRASGCEFLRGMNGQFGFALWDEQKNSLLVARDHVGIEPIYYADCEDYIVFSSKAAAASALLNGQRSKFDEAAIGRFLCFNFSKLRSLCIWSEYINIE